jgi:hypothetical protein
LKRMNFINNNLTSEKNAKVKTCRETVAAHRGQRCEVGRSWRVAGRSSPKK